MLKTITLLLVVVSVMSGVFFRPLHEFHLPLGGLDSLIVIQGNSLVQANELPILVKPISYATILGKNPNCPIELQCVNYVKSRGLNISGNAKDIRSSTDTPCVGCGVLLYSGKWGHIAYVERVLTDSIIISEQNWEGCGIISTRTVSLTDPDIRGYVY